MREDSLINNDVCAELLLHYKGLKDYSVRKAGRFYKGFRDDLMEVSVERKEVVLSRNGILQLLPEGLFYNDDYLKTASDHSVLKERIEQIQRQKMLNSCFFKAFDNVFFSQEMNLHGKIDEAETVKEIILLKKIYGINDRNYEGVDRSASRLLLSADMIRGDIRMLSFCIRSILGHEIECRCEKYYPSVRFLKNNIKPVSAIRLNIVLLIEKLTGEEYFDYMSKYKSFFEFLEYWFVPYDCKLSYCIKDKQQRFFLNNNLTLDYNTQLL